jgi:hypothetical protein
MWDFRAARRKHHARTGSLLTVISICLFHYNSFFGAPLIGLQGKLPPPSARPFYGILKIMYYLLQKAKLFSIIHSNFQAHKEIFDGIET